MSEISKTAMSKNMAPEMAVVYNVARLFYRVIYAPF